MSEELLEPEAPTPPAAKKGLGPAAILGLLLLVGALGFCGYIYSFWLTHNSRIARLKAKNGDFVQLQHRGDEDEFAAQPRNNRRRGGDSEAPEEGAEGAEGAAAPKKPEPPKEPSQLEKYINDMKPLPVQVVYWKDPGLTPADIELLLEFRDLEILSVKCDKIDSKTIERFLTLPRLRRLSIQATELDTSGLDSWKANEKFANLKLINTKWSGSEISDVLEKSESNKSIKNKVTATSTAGPSFGGM
ncbi:MAG: hypothetical protein ACK52S_20270 [Pirellula sp.]